MYQDTYISIVNVVVGNDLTFFRSDLEVSTYWSPINYSTVRRDKTLQTSDIPEGTKRENKKFAFGFNANLQINFKIISVQ